MLLSLSEQDASGLILGSVVYGRFSLKLKRAFVISAW